ncbi:MAG: tetratricopeptide repeat protein [Chitinispirillaceae bacterium]|nr:tetratricopeptide repeat protein [Chitinispirillaceae bacterium]
MNRHLQPLLFSLLATIIACNSPDMHKGTIALELGDYSMAIRFFARVLERDPAHFEARLGMGKSLLQRAFDNRNDTVSWRQAIMHLEAAHTIDSTADVHGLLSQVWAERASELLHAGDTLAALEALTRAIALDPQSTEPLNLAGIIYFRTGKTDKALQLFEHAATIDTINPTSLFNLGMLYWEEKRTKEAHDLWLRALKQSPQDEDFLYWFAVAEKNLRNGTPADSESKGSGR